MVPFVTRRRAEWPIAILSVLLMAACRPQRVVNDPSPLAIVGATVIDGTGASPLSDAIVLVDGDRITGVGGPDELSISPDARRIDVSGKWIVPGLVDAHVHFFQSGGLYTRPDVIDLRHVRSYEREQARIRERLPRTLCRYLESGVTSVVDLGGPFWNFDVREYARQVELAPHVAVAGPLLSPHASEALKTPDPPIIAVASIDEARALVRRQLRRRPDLVKIWFIASPPREPAAFAPIAEAAIEESHAGGVRAAVHATRLDIARTAVDAGAEILAHSVVDRVVGEAFVAAAKRNDVVYTTTLLVFRRYDEVLHDRVRLTEIERRVGDPEAIDSWVDLDREPAERRPPSKDRAAFGPPHEAMENLRRMQDAGVVIAAGSDAGNIGTLHGPSLHAELALMVEAGLSNHEVLVAATRGGAKVMGRARDLGTLQPGKLADFLILDADPLERLDHLEQIHRIVKGGVPMDPRGLCDPLD